MKNNKTMYVLFAIVLLSIYLNLAWDAAGMISPVYYNMVMGTIFTCFALLHGNTYMGRKSIVVLAVLAFVISFIMEYAGVKTGFIYGEYHYGAVLGPKALDTVPWLIPLSWFMFMYVSTVTVDAAFGGRYTGWAAPLLFAVLDSVAMTALDVLIDPLWVKRGTWIWTAVQLLPAGSVFYGIPVQNYFGWLLTTIIIFIPYRIILFGNRADSCCPRPGFFSAMFDLRIDYRSRLHRIMDCSVEHRCTVCSAYDRGRLFYRGTSWIHGISKSPIYSSTP